MDLKTIEKDFLPTLKSNERKLIDSIFGIIGIDFDDKNAQIIAETIREYIDKNKKYIEVPVIRYRDKSVYHRIVRCEQQIPVDKIESIVRECTGVGNADLTKTRKRPIAFPRQLIHYFASKHTSLSHSQIAYRCGRLERSSVSHSSYAINRYISSKYPQKEYDIILKCAQMISELIPVSNQDSNGTEQAA